MTGARIFLGLLALGFIALGLNGLLNPLGHLAPYGLDHQTPAWLGEIRANYGGMHIGIGLLTGLGAIRKHWLQSALAVQLVFLGGLAVGRTASVFLDGVPPTFALTFIAIEWVGAGLAFFFLRRAS